MSLKSCSCCFTSWKKNVMIIEHFNWSSHPDPVSMWKVSGNMFFWYLLCRSHMFTLLCCACWICCSSHARSLAGAVVSVLQWNLHADTSASSFKTVVSKIIHLDQGWVSGCFYTNSTQLSAIVTDVWLFTAAVCSAHAQFYTDENLHSGFKRLRCEKTAAVAVYTSSQNAAEMLCFT